MVREVEAAVILQTTRTNNGMQLELTIGFSSSGSKSAADTDDGRTIIFRNISSEWSAIRN